VEWCILKKCHTYTEPSSIFYTKNYCCHKYFVISFLPWSNDTNFPTGNSHMHMRVVSYITGLPHSHRQAELTHKLNFILTHSNAYSILHINFIKWMLIFKCIWCFDEANCLIFLPDFNTFSPSRVLVLRSLSRQLPWRSTSTSLIFICLLTKKYWRYWLQVCTITLLHGCSFSDCSRFTKVCKGMTDSRVEGCAVSYFDVWLNACLCCNHSWHTL
jgi:hypothetical protein